MDINKIDVTAAKSLLENAGIDQNLISLIMQCANSRDYFYVAKYHYGEKIIDKGRLLLDSNLDKEIQDDLIYNAGSNPLSIILSGCAELYLENDNDIIPYAVFKKGQVASSWLALDDFNNSYHPRFIWDMSAGIRSAFLINSVSRERNHKALSKKLELPLVKPNNIKEHFTIFKDITNKYSDDWCLTSFIFPKAIIDQLRTRWDPLRLYLIERAWMASSYLRNSFLWNSIYSVLISQLNLRVSAYDLSCIKHIIGVSSANALGFEPCISDEYLPLGILQTSYYEFYGLEQFNQVPTIMIPAYKNGDKSIYYSFSHPNNIETPIKVDSYSSDRKYANYLEHIFIKIAENIDEIAASDYSPIIKALRHTTFEFKDSIEDLSKDDRFFYYHPEKRSLKNKEIPKHNNFLRTYIKIT